MATIRTILRLLTTDIRHLIRTSQQDTRRCMEWLHQDSTRRTTVHSKVGFPATLNPTRITAAVSQHNRSGRGRVAFRRVSIRCLSPQTPTRMHTTKILRTPTKAKALKNTRAKNFSTLLTWTRKKKDL